MADMRLIDACFMWCMHRDIKPRAYSDKEDMGMLRQAVDEYEGTFKQLNNAQRERIAGLAQPPAS